MNSRTVYCVVETEAKLEEHRYNPGRILLCNRTYIQNTPKGGYIKGTHELHEVQSVATSETIPTWPSFQERHPGITITHRLAVVDNFKGNHD